MNSCIIVTIAIRCLALDTGTGKLYSAEEATEKLAKRNAVRQCELRAPDPFNCFEYGKCKDVSKTEPCPKSVRK